jgi:hypothetical protein
MRRRQSPHLARNAEQLADKILEMRRQIDQQVRFLARFQRRRVAPRRHQAIVQLHLAGREMRDKSTIQAHEPVAIVKIGEHEAVLENKIRHQVLVRAD